jgi:hypothetical protein
MTASTAAAACPFSWCIYDRAGHSEHAWTDSVPAKVVGDPGRVYAYAVTDDTDDTRRADDQVLIGIQRGNDHEGAEEGWLSIEDAGHLRATLDKAITYAGGNSSHDAHISLRPRPRRPPSRASRAGIRGAAEQAVPRRPDHLREILAFVAIARPAMDRKRAQQNPPTPLKLVRSGKRRHAPS